MAISLKPEADKAGSHPSRRFGQRERKLLESVAAAIPFQVLAAGVYTTIAGTSQTITVASAKTGDIVVVSVKTAGAVPVSVVAASAGNGSISVTMSATPSTDHVLQYIVVRALA